MAEYTNDPKVQVKSFSIGLKESRAGSLLADYDRNRLQFRFNPEQVASLITALTTVLKTGDGAVNGVKLDIHTGKRKTNEGGRIFDAAFMFVKPVQNAPGREGTNSSDMATAVGGGTGRTEFAPVTNAADFKASGK